LLPNQLAVLLMIGAYGNSIAAICRSFVLFAKQQWEKYWYAF
jgi:hypothetical protein